jgi:hypothetical protein
VHCKQASDVDSRERLLLVETIFDTAKAALLYRDERNIDIPSWFQERLLVLEDSFWANSKYSVTYSLVECRFPFAETVFTDFVTKYFHSQLVS